MKTIEVVCDVRGCHALGTLSLAEPGDPACSACGAHEGDPEGFEAPIGWGTIAASDSSGELQRHFVCPVHNSWLWQLLEGERRS